MEKQIKLPSINFAKVGNTLIETGKVVGTFIRTHALEILVGTLAGVTIDNIRVRIGRKKDQKFFEANTLKQQQVIRKHEAEINVLKDEADRYEEARQKVEQLAKIVNNITEGSSSE